MFRRFKWLAGLFAIVCVSAIAAGSAYFYFGKTDNGVDETITNKTETGDDESNIAADNILENYDFGAEKNLNETYTYYFFPSTLYMELYDKNYKEPEKVFGYNEVLLDDNGDPALTSDNQPQYKIVNDNVSGVSNYKTYYEEFA